MVRSRSRSPRRKDRRRSRSRDRNDKRLDKFGRDVGSRSERRGRDEYSRSHDKRDHSSRQRKDYSSSRYDSYDDRSRHANGDSSRYDSRRYDNDAEYEQRQQFKEMFEEKDVVYDEETRKLEQLMGFNGFDTTKNKKQSGNPSGFAKINKPQKYRQYMNRRGGFNRPLDWVG